MKSKFIFPFNIQKKKEIGFVISNLKFLLKSKFWNEAINFSIVILIVYQIGLESSLFVMLKNERLYSCLFLSFEFEIPYRMANEGWWVFTRLQEFPIKAWPISMVYFLKSESNNLRL